MGTALGAPIGAPQNRRVERRLLAAGIMFFALLATAVAFGIMEVNSSQNDLKTLAESDFPTLNVLVRIEHDLFGAQTTLTSATWQVIPATREASLNEYRRQLQLGDANWARYLQIARNDPAEHATQRRYLASRQSWIEGGIVVEKLMQEGLSSPNQQITTALATRDRQFQLAQNSLHTLEQDFYGPLVDRGAERDGSDPRIILLVLLGLGVLLGGTAWVWALHSSRRQADELLERDAREAARSAAENERFRSLVKSAKDVIVIVSDVDSLSIMSATAGMLSNTDGSTPGSVTKALPPAAFVKWKAADDRVIAEKISVSTQFEIQRGNAEPVHVEAVGRPIDSTTRDRAWVFRDITDRKRLETQLEHQAFHDPLTGVANRALLQDRTSHALHRSSRSDQPVSMIFCDLDDFKSVNDSLGHEMGDELLEVVARRMQECIRNSDTLARFGGDEFVMLLEDADIRQAQTIAARILAVIPLQIQLGSHTYCPSVSIGVATAVPGATPDELIRNADIAMYEAKANGKGHVETFQHDMHHVASELLDLQMALRGALDRNELVLRYQPTFSLESGELEGVEALLRWDHPEIGEISPDVFIPIAESTGLIIPIGRWTIREAMRTAALLQDGGSMLMHVNLSPLQLRDPLIVACVRDAIAESNVPPELVVLEVTEGMLLDDNVAIERLHELRALDVRIALDDFGTGYTSINYLRQLPVDIIKIDRSFISGDALPLPERRAFLNAILGLVSSLKLHSVAEGIEDATQLEELRELGCDTGQGYFWSPAIDLDDLLARRYEFVDSNHQQAA